MGQSIGRGKIIGLFCLNKIVFMHFWRLLFPSVSKIIFAFAFFFFSFFSHFERQRLLAPPSSLSAEILEPCEHSARGKRILHTQKNVLGKQQHGSLYGIFKPCLRVLVWRHVPLFTGLKVTSNNGQLHGVLQ